MTYTLYYRAHETGEDGRPNGKWEVRSCEYETIASPLPIRGTDKSVSRNHPTEDEADTKARSLQRRSYAENRKAHNG